MQQKLETKQIQKEQILAFDRELIECDPDRVFTSKILYIIAGVLGCFMMVFPFDPKVESDQNVLCILAWMFLGIAVIFRLQPYISIGDQGRICTLLAYVPVDKALLCQVRRQYLRRFLIKIGVLCFLFQQMGALFDHNWSVWTLIYPAGMILFLYLAGIAYIGKNH